MSQEEVAETAVRGERGEEGVAANMTCVRRMLKSFSKYGNCNNNYLSRAKSSHTKDSFPANVTNVCVFYFIRLRAILLCERHSAVKGTPLCNSLKLKHLSSGIKLVQRGATVKARQNLFTRIIVI